MRTESVGFSSATADGLAIFRDAILAFPLANPRHASLLFALGNPLEAIFLVPKSFLDGIFAIWPAIRFLRSTADSAHPASCETPSPCRRRCRPRRCRRVRWLARGAASPRPVAISADSRPHPERPTSATAWGRRPTTAEGRAGHRG